MEVSVKLTLCTLCLYLIAVTSSAKVNATTPANKQICPGPTKYYVDIGCKPVYETPQSSCPYKWNCDHLKDRSDDKCYIDGHEYSIGENLREEHRNPCDIGCTCRKSFGVTRFVCAVVDCFYPPPRNSSCYRQRQATSCCPGREVCPEKPEDRPTCEVDGKIYKDGEHFVPTSEPDKTCYCGPNYKGENNEPFCRSIRHSCRIDLHHAYELKNNCTPTYYHHQSPDKDCSLEYRCQNDNDEVITLNRSAGAEDADMQCQFGNLTMRRGDELKSATGYSSVCVKCICEVGPAPTCQRLSEDECDVTKHPDFD